MKKWIAMAIGCIECGVSTEVLGVFNSEEEAQNIADASPSWRQGGQSSGEVFEIKV